MYKNELEIIELAEDQFEELLERLSTEGFDSQITEGNSSLIEENFIH